MAMMKQCLKDWWRGYSMADQLSVIAKLSSDEAKRPDGVIVMTQREIRASNDINAFLDKRFA